MKKKYPSPMQGKLMCVCLGFWQFRSGRGTRRTGSRPACVGMERNVSSFRFRFPLLIESKRERRESEAPRVEALMVN